MKRLLQQKALDNYFELLANERSETERLFILKALERKELESRPERGGMVARVQAKHYG